MRLNFPELFYVRVLPKVVLSLFSVALSSFNAEFSLFGQMLNSAAEPIVFVLVIVVYVPSLFTDCKFLVDDSSTCIVSLDVTLSPWLLKVKACSVIASVLRSTLNKLAGVNIILFSRKISRNMAIVSNIGNLHPAINVTIMLPDLKIQ